MPDVADQSTLPGVPPETYRPALSDVPIDTYRPASPEAYHLTLPETPLPGDAHKGHHKTLALESACPHQGVAAVYDPKRHLLVCPGHNSAFDPAAGGRAVSGPATAPLKSVKIQLLADGSISTA